MITKRKLFRTQALKQYAQNKQKDILPGFVTPPVFLCLWLLLLVVASAAFFAWQESVPVYTHILGIILAQRNKPATALLFVPPGSATSITVGQKIIFQVNATRQQFRASVASVDRGSITPGKARARYALTGDTQFVITQPSLVVHLNLTPQQARQVVDHLSMTAQLQVGSRSLLSMLPGLLGNAFGG